VSKQTYIIEIPMDNSNENNAYTYLIESDYGSEFIRHSITTFFEQYTSEIDKQNNSNPLGLISFLFKSQSAEEVSDIFEIENYIFTILDFIDDFDTLMEFNVHTLEEWVDIKKKYGQKAFNTED
jgi:hypothetical protein